MQIKKLTLKQIVAIIFAIATIVISWTLTIRGDISYEEFKDTTTNQVDVIEDNLIEETNE